MKKDMTKRYDIIPDALPEDAYIAAIDAAVKVATDWNERSDALTDAAVEFLINVFKARRVL